MKIFLSTVFGVMDFFNSGWFDSVIHIYEKLVKFQDINRSNEMLKKAKEKADDLNKR